MSAPPYLLCKALPPCPRGRARYEVVREGELAALREQMLIAACSRGWDRVELAILPRGTRSGRCKVCHGVWVYRVIWCDIYRRILVQESTSFM